MTIQVNNKGVSFAHSLIRNGKIDFSSDWSFSASDGNKLLGSEGNDWNNYAKYHLAEDTSQPEETKARYKYPFGKNDKIFRRGVIAAKTRAAQQGQDNIANAANDLLESIDKNKEDKCGTKKMHDSFVAIIKDVSEFIENSIEWTSLGEENPFGVWAYTGKLKSDENITAIHSYEFITSFWKEDQAKQWLKENEIEIKDFQVEKTKKKVDQRFDVVQFFPAPCDEEGKKEIESSLYKKMERTSEGFLHGRAVVTNVGVFPYILEDGTIRRELRVPEEIFNNSSIETIKHKPVTLSHPKELVTSENAKNLAIGFIGDEVITDAYHISVPITITDETSIKAIESGKHALSCGYLADVEMESGVWMGVPYDAKQRNIRYNHLAIVDQGRAGDAAVMRLDSKETFCADDEELVSVGYISKISEDKKPMVKLTLDGVDFQVDPKILEKIQAVEKNLSEANTLLDGLKKNSSTLEAERDSLKENVENLKKEIEAAKKIANDNLENAVKNRFAILDGAKKAGIEVKEGMTELEIKKAVILKASPNAAAKLEKADEVYINARFDGALELLDNQNAIAIENKKAITTIPEAKKDEVDPREKMIRDLKNAYKGN